MGGVGRSEYAKFLNIVKILNKLVKNKLTKQVYAMRYIRVTILWSYLRNIQEGLSEEVEM